MKPLTFVIIALAAAFPIFLVPYIVYLLYILYQSHKLSKKQ
jgi:hypothetical protein